MLVEFVFFLCLKPLCLFHCKFKVNISLQGVKTLSLAFDVSDVLKDEFVYNILSLFPYFELSNGPYIKRPLTATITLFHHFRFVCVCVCVCVVEHYEKQITKILWTRERRGERMGSAHDYE